MMSVSCERQTRHRKLNETQTGAVHRNIGAPPPHSIAHPLPAPHISSIASP
jgi:hypothetical protein